MDEYMIPKSPEIVELYKVEPVSSPMFDAVTANDLEEVKRLIDAGEPVVGNDRTNATCLALAVERGNLELVKLLLPHSPLDTLTVRPLDFGRMLCQYTLLELAGDPDVKACIQEEIAKRN